MHVDRSLILRAQIIQFFPFFQNSFSIYENFRENPEQKKCRPGGRHVIRWGSRNREAVPCQGRGMGWGGRKNGVPVPAGTGTVLVVKRSWRMTGCLSPRGQAPRSWRVPVPMREQAQELAGASPHAGTGTGVGGCQSPCGDRHPGQS
ncbi:hypothetical protein L533_2801 [Bordetella bronchiseptica OSU553]|nr:hypothetical protein L533_2801 [Bordetella bronchiseptica OSU553]